MDSILAATRTRRSTLRTTAAVLATLAFASACTTVVPPTTSPSMPPPTATASPSEQATATPTPTPIPLPQGSDPVVLDPADFVAAIDHPYWPMTPGSRWVYRETDADGTVQQVEVTVTDMTKEILGITATVVHDVVTEDGDLVEDTFDWYAQDRSGNLWYLGEDTKEYEGGEVVSTAGSWEAGVDGAQPGIILPAQPEVGLAYRQEYLAGEAEDAARILSLTERADVPFGTFDQLLMTEETTPLEPGLRERKYYARGIGLVFAEVVAGGASREELLTYTRGGTS